MEYINPIIAIQRAIINKLINKFGNINIAINIIANIINILIALTNVIGSIPQSSSLPHKFRIKFFINTD